MQAASTSIRSRLMGTNVALRAALLSILGLLTVQFTKAAEPEGVEARLRVVHPAEERERPDRERHVLLAELRRRVVERRGRDLRIPAGEEIVRDLGVADRCAGRRAAFRSSARGGGHAADGRAIS